jgi:hypothetical protein
MPQKGNSIPDDDRALLQLVSDSAPYFHHPDREIEFKFTPPEVTTTFLLEQPTIFRSSFAREWLLGRRASAAWYAASSRFDETVEELRRSDPYAYYIVPDPSLRKPEPELDLDSHLGLHTDADKLFFKKCDGFWRAKRG